METGIWSAKEYLQYSTKERVTENIVKDQLICNLEQTFYSKVNSVSKETQGDVKNRVIGEVNIEEIDQTKDQGKNKKKTVLENKKKN